MKYTISLILTAAAVQASPLLNIRQGVTDRLTPTAAAPSGYTADYSGTFGIAAENVTSSAAAQKRQVTTLSDGQPQANTVSAVPVSAISDGQPQASTAQTSRTLAPITQISDGQPQQGPKQTVVPVSQISDGQIQNPTVTLAPVSQISDGQIQNPPKSTVPPVSQISDGQPQNPKPSATPISQISDGQPQNPKSSATPISQISDGQPQNPTATQTPISQISDGQPQKPTSTQAAATQKTDGQPNQPSSTVATVPRVSSVSDTQPQQPSGAGSAPPAGPSTVMVACRSDSTLELTLNNGVLKDNKGRTGYIASNFQFQFDDPPQAGAIYTAGFSVSNTNGTLALGGSSTFYQCLSGNFYNLYDRSWAAQCNPVNIQVLQLENCS